MIEISLRLSNDDIEKALKHEARIASGHVGTHIDLKGKNVSLNNRECIVLDIDSDLNDVKENDFVIFKTGHIEKYEYCSKNYFSNHPIISDEQIKKLIEKKVSFIGIDAPGIKSGKEHPLIDEYLANKGIFVVENICNLNKLECNHRCQIKMETYSQINDGMPVRLLVSDESNNN